jgi:hypothetical protein
LRVERGRFWPVLTYGTHTLERALSLGVEIKPWQRDGRHILVCLQGFKFGRPWGIDIKRWNWSGVKRIKGCTDRPIVVRPKPLYRKSSVPLETDMEGAWCVVTHSSTAAVKAVLAGVPVFCEPTCAAAVVGCTDLSQIENPVRPDREAWVAELAWRQFSRSEMQSGMAWAHIKDER